MSLSYWNQQFQFTKILPDFQECLESMAERSAQVPMAFQRLAYGADARQFVELAGEPERGGVLPVFIHGGYWRALTAEQHRFVLPALSGSSGCVANLEYRLLPHVTLTEIVADCVSGLRKLADETGCRLVLVGHSAGGHLAVSAARELPETVVGAVGISGLYDLPPLQWSFLREEVGLKREDLNGLSPQELWDGRDAGHVIVAVGADETNEFHRQARMFADTHGARFVAIPAAHHMTVLNDLADPNGSLLGQIRTMLSRSTH